MTTLFLFDTTYFFIKTLWPSDWRFMNIYFINISCKTNFTFRIAIQMILMNYRFTNEIRWNIA